MLCVQDPTLTFFKKVTDSRTSQVCRLWEVVQYYIWLLRQVFKVAKVVSRNKSVKITVSKLAPEPESRSSDSTTKSSTGVESNKLKADPGAGSDHDHHDCANNSTSHSETVTPCISPTTSGMSAN